MKRNFLILTVIVLLFFSMCSCSKQKKEIDTRDITEIAKEFVTQLENGKYQECTKNFDLVMKVAMSKKKLEEVWTNLLSQTGQFKKQVDTRTDKYEQYDIIFVTCEFEKSTIDIKVVFNEKKQVSGLFFIPAQLTSEYEPPDYIDEKSFKEIEVVIGEEGEWALPGTLTLPEGEGKFPVVILVHGSGPQDRDETIGPNKPFKDIAMGLASAGIAVLRYEKRTKEHQEKLISIKDNITVKEETIDDVLAAIALVKNRDEIDTKKIFILGHSLGGYLIPRIAILTKDAAGYILLAGSTRNMEDMIIDQVFYIFSLDGKIDEDEKKNIAELEKQVERVRHLTNSSKVKAEKLPLGIPSSYWLDLKSYNVKKEVKKIEVPLLILQGERDYQVTMVNLEGWQEALKGKTNVQFKTYPKLNHLFIEGEEKSKPEEYMEPGHVSEEVIMDISNWINSLR